jgi:anti-sigma-K factor RskA
MTCNELQDAYELYALGVLDGEEKAEIDAHLARGCEDCRKGLADARAMNAALLSFVPEEYPSARLKRRVMEGIGVRHPGWGPWWGWLGAFAAALMFIVALWLAVQERDRTAQLADARRTVLQMSAERDRLTQALQFLSDPQTLPASFGKGPAAPPRGYVFLHPQLGVLLIASNLPAAGQGKTYEMWVIPKGGAPRPAGLFQSDGARAVHILNGPIDLATLGVVAVTVEPEAGSAAPTTQPIIAAPVGT